MRISLDLKHWVTIGASIVLPNIVQFIMVGMFLNAGCLFDCWLSSIHQSKQYQILPPQLHLIITLFSCAHPLQYCLGIVCMLIFKFPIFLYKPNAQVTATADDMQSAEGAINDSANAAGRVCVSVQARSSLLGYL